MAKIRYLIILSLLIFIKINVLSQFYSTGEPPASVKWNEIKTPHYKLIFPVEVSEVAEDLASKFEYYYPFTAGDMIPAVKRRIPVVLHNTSVISNGYVTLAPRRMELVLTPPQDLLAQDWSSYLILHESRHGTQIDKQYQGITRLLSYFTGDIAPGIVSSQIPSWFYEGDAVYNETKLSNSGRGRWPGFEMPLKPILNENSRQFSYDKAIFGSYKDFVPDHYIYGYKITSYARKKYGNDIWPQALNYTSRNPFLIWPFTVYLKKNYGLFKSELYRQTIDSAGNEYKIREKKGSYSIYKHLNIKKKGFINYLLPKDLNGTSTVTVSKGLSDPGSIVVIDSTGNIKKKWIIGFSTNLKNDLYENNLIWDEIVVDPRWGRRDYSVIRSLNLKNGKTRNLTRKTKYFSPDFSPDGKLIAVIETGDANENYLTIIQSNTGKFIKRVPAVNKILQTPEWVNDNEVCVVTVTEKGKQLEIINVSDEKWRIILENTHLNIAEPLIFSDYIIFRCGFNETDNLFAIHLNNEELFQVTNCRYGAFNPSISKDSDYIIFSEYGLYGFDVAKLNLTPESWVKLDTNELKQKNTFLTPINDSIKTVQTIKKYRKTIHLFRFHSWLPLYTDIEDMMDDPLNTKVYPGFMLFSQNLLNTLTSSFSYSYSNGYHLFIPSLKWRGFYPVIELSGQIGGPVIKLAVPSEISVPNEIYKELTLKIFVPLVFYRGKYMTFVQPRIEYQWSSLWYYRNNSLKNGIDFLHIKFNLHNIQRTALRDIYPKWGQSFYVTQILSLSNRDLFGTLASFESNFFFPGIFPHNSLNIYASYQFQNTHHYFIPFNRIDFPRGYLMKMSKEFSTVQLNYSFPFLYPDLSLGPLLYLKRFRANVFYDAGYEIDVFRKGSFYHSYGFESFVDFHALRIIFPLSVGIRLGYVPDYRDVFSEILFTINTSIF